MAQGAIRHRIRAHRLRNRASSLVLITSRCTLPQGGQLHGDRGLNTQSASVRQGYEETEVGGRSFMRFLGPLEVSGVLAGGRPRQASLPAVGFVSVRGGGVGGGSSFSADGDLTVFFFPQPPVTATSRTTGRPTSSAVLALIPSFPCLKSFLAHDTTQRPRGRPPGPVQTGSLVPFGPGCNRNRGWRTRPRPGLR